MLRTFTVIMYVWQILSFGKATSITNSFFLTERQGSGLLNNHPLAEIVGQATLRRLVRVGFFDNHAAVELHAAADPTKISGRIVGRSVNILESEIVDFGDIAIEINLQQTGAAGESIVSQYREGGREVQFSDAGAAGESIVLYFRQTTGEGDALQRSTAIEGVLRNLGNAVREDDF